MIRRSSWDTAHCHSPGYLSGRTVGFSSASSSPASTSTLPLSSPSRSSGSSSSLCSLSSGEFCSWGATGLRQLWLSRRRRFCHKVWNPPIFWTSWCLTIKSSLISYHLFYIHLLFFSFFSVWYLLYIFYAQPRREVPGREFWLWQAWAQLVSVSFWQDHHHHHNLHHNCHYYHIFTIRYVNTNEDVGDFRVQLSNSSGTLLVKDIGYANRWP